MRYYADSAATTPLHPEARRVMDEWNQREFGNASSLYAEGRRARAALAQVVHRIAQVAAVGDRLGLEAFEPAVDDAVEHDLPRGRLAVVAAVAHHQHAVGVHLHR